MTQKQLRATDVDVISVDFPTATKGFFILFRPTPHTPCNKMTGKGFQERVLLKFPY